MAQNKVEQDLVATWSPPILRIPLKTRRRQTPSAVLQPLGETAER